MEYCFLFRFLPFLDHAWGVSSLLPSHTYMCIICGLSVFISFLNFHFSLVIVEELRGVQFREY